jgi:hypothetical protein
MEADQISSVLHFGLCGWSAVLVVLVLAPSTSVWSYLLCGLHGGGTGRVWGCERAVRLALASDAAATAARPSVRKAHESHSATTPTNLSSFGALRPFAAYRH